MNGFTGPSGTGANYTLQLSDLNTGTKIWKGRIFVSGTLTILTKNLGEIVAKSIADTMNQSQLFSSDVLSTSHSDGGQNPRSTSFSAAQLQEFLKFKGLPSPKAFVVGDGGKSFIASGQEGTEDVPSIRALKTCVEQKINNCRVIADGKEVF